MANIDKLQQISANSDHFRLNKDFRHLIFGQHRPTPAKVARHFVKIRQIVAEFGNIQQVRLNQLIGGIVV